MIRELGPISYDVLNNTWLDIPYLQVAVDGRPIRYARSNRLSTKRLETLFSKEPTTIPWLETFTADDVFVDVGANVGIYTIYASIMTGARVFAFEPEALNYAELNKNIYLNGLHTQVIAYCAALSDTSAVNQLFLGGFAEGLSHHDFGENTWGRDKDFGPLQTKKDERLHQGCVAFPLDELIKREQILRPTHIKVDVDGLEHRVIRGCLETLADQRLKSILIEIDHTIPSNCEIIDTLLSLGWRYSLSQLRANRKVVFTEGQITTMRREGKGGLNYIFFRDEMYERLFHNFLQTYAPPM